MKMKARIALVFVSLLEGDDSKFSRAPVINHSISGMFAIRNGDYKLVLGNGSGGRQNPKGRAWEKPFTLFDLNKDISETKDIISDHQDLAKSMEEELKHIMDSGNSKTIR